MILTIINTVLIVSGISGFLALLLVIADYFFANYGECKISINKKKELKVEGGSSLLSTLNENKIFLPSACGGRGSCGFCKCKIDSGGGPLLPTEKPYLDAEEIKNNIRLSCQVKVKEDIEIEIPEEIFNIKKFRTKVSKISDLTYDIKELTLDLLEPNEINFKAGQYMQLISPRYGKVKQSVSRAYSISSSPDNKDFIQLIIRKVPEGICTTWVHEFLKEGDKVNVTGPFGDFYIRDTNADMIFVAGGSGKAPIKSMLEYLAKRENPRRMGYFFGARQRKELYYTELFKELEEKLPDFKYYPILSQPTEACDWDGRCGYVMPFFDEFIKEPKNTEAYLCGSPGMIQAVTNDLKKRGIPEDKIYYDSFA
ncbi:MAG: 2Fe-2S iron-sulfur cluster binding domain-containing protein [Candidatus Cloacimonetes bacterium]|nr:2Fe-2S iron-sulfur cluster binding domain-containing protein [Candidatus Cloacimonadota bacterium]MCF7813014.1 2Fe-2S iron-sulfur cluster binding domain-containing protein [Candidatus Cloacimonadota bacterium]MCF7867254.1 2Fe-2S iron-sulfur cluster binding domain-containing protein [Candidatus Cloacimonadota bacterium]MCF7882698.1 2Fe-2S iron-sulfur cluster binding domain-containing protein [Candidatus Cloacimonadota bacterium]